MRLWRSIRANGVRRGLRLWHKSRAMDAAIARYRREDEMVERRLPQWRPFHGDKPRLTGYRQSRRRAR